MTPSTTVPTTFTPYPIHYMASITIVTSASGGGQGTVTEYGNEMTVDAEFEENNRDRGGASFLDLLDDEPAQVRRWGQVMVRRGPWPADLPRVEPGSLRWHDQAAAARVEASKITDASLRHDRQREINAEYGPRPSTSTTLATYPAPAAS